MLTSQDVLKSYRSHGRQRQSDNRRKALELDGVQYGPDSTLLASIAEVSMKLKLLSAAKVLASSVGTARRCLRSLLFPTSMMTMLLSA